MLHMEFPWNFRRGVLEGSIHFPGGMDGSSLTNGSMESQMDPMPDGKPTSKYQAATIAPGRVLTRPGPIKGLGA